MCEKCKCNIDDKKKCKKDCKCNDTKQETEFLDSMALGYATNNGILGGILGGDIMGGIVGDMLHKGGLL